jgi:hypothetical protein
VTDGGLGGLAGVDLTGGDLDGRVAVLLERADLGHDVRSDLDDGDGDELVVLVPDLGHAELLAEQALDVLSGADGHGRPPTA